MKKLVKKSYLPDMKEGTKKGNKRHNAVTFKSYEQDQIWLLPPSLGQLIPSNHVVRIVNAVIDGMDLKHILHHYKGGGTSSYHPRMLLKALIYGYICKQYSSRAIEKSCQENICFMWLCGMQQPDHNTLNRFRKEKLKDTVKTVFAHVLSLLVEQGYVRLQDYYVDGTKIESVANRYTFVWAKNIDRYKSGLIDKIAHIIAQIEQTNDQEEQAFVQKEASAKKKDDTAEVNQQEEAEPTITDSTTLKAKITELNTALATSSSDNKKLKRQLKKLEQKHLPKLQEYEEHERQLAGRNSYSKTDPDATFMRTKDDHLGNGQLKPCYNWQFGTENQFIINYTVHQTASDMSVFVDHMEDTLALLNQEELTPPQRVGADAGYGSEQNYEYLEEQNLEAFVKYPGYFAESKKPKAKQAFHVRHLYYNEQKDYLVCPMGQKMRLVKQTKQTTKTDYVQTVGHYQAQNCEGCPLRGACFKAKEPNRIVKFNRKSYEYRKAAKQRLQTLRGIKMKKQRNIDVEPVFGHIKQCRGFRRCLLRGLDGVRTETGLLALAHNFKKMAVHAQIHRITTPSPLQNPPNMVQMQPISTQLDLKGIKRRA